MNGHKYKILGRKAFFLICHSSWLWQSSRGIELSLTYEDKQDCIAEAIEAIIKAANNHPQHADNELYLIVCAKNRILQFLFGSHHKVLKRSRGLIFNRAEDSPRSIQGWLDREIATGRERYEDDFVEKNFYEIYELFLSVRKKKGARGEAASMRDALIVKLASQGWKNSDIAIELGIPISHVNDYRKSIRKALKAVHSRQF